MKNALTRKEIAHVLHDLNYRWKLAALALWKGGRHSVQLDRIYHGYEDFVSRATLTRIDELEGKTTQIRLKSALMDHYLRRALLPHETEMQAWQRGAAAIVDGERIYFRGIIPWCQKSSTYAKRQVLQKETGALCKFLKPFALNYWNILLDIIRKDLGFEDYIEYCRWKKGVNYHHYYEILKDFLRKTDRRYLTAMEAWSRQRFGLPLSALTRFDAINLLGLGEFDAWFPPRTPEELTDFFRFWHIDPQNTPGLHLELGREEGKSAQAMSFILQIPDEIFILMRPEGGWIDLETLWHELGHGLAAAFTSPALALVDRELATAFSLSESFAFLLQNLTLSPAFLHDYLGMATAQSDTLSQYKVLKDFALFRRYAAKFIAEFEMFANGDLSNGEPYAATMARYTGFFHQPESHLFDLVPEFYCLDYLLGWMAEAMLEEHLTARLGSRWIYHETTGRILRAWWAQGNRYDIFQFMERNGLGGLSLNRLLERWERL